ncbi:alpha/beta fold hydrolase [Natronolimnobius sp. AArcel1]|uniref:acyl-CoA thioester hydrolase/BAAT C-terminal domain-containing protein n=1 Tax=Natronolimnobius sp. AArcel1 TaxID=1679093 RepID=UPI0013EC2EBD|nr:acyl-CoA thioester hydrolase/BAAT C-terminal domain-containing protein [Natronolimnobius sp. AArcel1]NGM69520.1 alpha/beta fold hydrolase [Natronolimnobius sp. AArcel1]
MNERFLSGTTIRTEDVNGRLFQGLGDGPRPGVLVLHGAGGARGYEQEYAALLAEHGYTVLCVEYFGASGVRDRLLEVPLEEFNHAAEWLLQRPDVSGDQVGVVGFSRGGEASLLAGSTFDTIGCIIAYVPSCYVWPAPSWMDGVGEDQPTWLLDGEPLPHLHVDKYVDESEEDEPFPDEEPISSTPAIDQPTPKERARAEIPVEDIDGPVLLISGEQDTIWPSTRMAECAVERLEKHEHPWQFEHCSFPEAGHAIRVPYRFNADTSPADTHRFGGTHAANARASARAWQAMLEYLDRL